MQQQQVLLEHEQHVPSFTMQLRLSGGGDGDVCAMCVCYVCVRSGLGPETTPARGGPLDGGVADHTVQS